MEAFPDVSPEAQEVKAWGGGEHRRTPSKNVCGQREATEAAREGTTGVRTALPATRAATAPDTPTASCHSSPQGRPASLGGFPRQLSAPCLFPVSPRPTLEGELLKAGPLLLEK